MNYVACFPVIARSGATKQSPGLRGDCFVGKTTLLATLAPGASAGVTETEGRE